MKKNFTKLKKKYLMILELYLKNKQENSKKHIIIKCKNLKLIIKLYINKMNIFKKIMKKYYLKINVLVIIRLQILKHLIQKIYIIIRIWEHKH